MKTFMRRFPYFFVALACVTVLQAQEKPAPPPKPIDITGKWTMTLNMEIGTATPALVFKQTGEKITGTYTGRYGEFPFEGTLKGKAIAFSFSMNTDGGQTTMSFKGEVEADGESMKGEASIEGLGDASFTAKKNKN